MLSFFDSITGSYALALLFYALIFKIVFLPFSIKQQKNQVKMAKLTPKIELIRAKYKGRTDQVTMRKQQEEIMELQQKEGYSPLSGCLPLLIQLPLIMLLYAVIQNPLSYMAKTTDAVNSYNDIRDSYVIDENNPSSFEINYKDMIGEKKNISLNDVIYRVYYNIPLSNGTTRATDDSIDPKDKEFVPKNYEISLINEIYNFVDNPANIDYFNIFGDREARIRFVENFGLSYTSIPNFRVFGVNLAETPSLTNFSILVIIPVLAAASSWLSMWLTRKMNKNAMVTAQDAQSAASMKIMDLVMPIMTLFIAFNFSGMLGLYWVYQSALGLVQSFIISKAMPLPQYTEEELKAMRKAQKEAEKAQRDAAKAQPKHRSLHYIDEDDYEELPDIKKNSDNKKTAMGSDMPEIKD